jgi:ABC-type phosphate transport system ATPase subunit
LDDVAFGPLNLGKSKEEAMAVAEKTLDFLGLKGFEDRVTHKLSGGEKRLVSLATILAMEPEVLLLDEPSTGLDAATKEKLIEILERTGTLNCTHLPRVRLPVSDSPATSTPWITAVFYSTMSCTSTHLLGKPTNMPISWAEYQQPHRHV